MPSPWIVTRRLHASGLVEPRFTTPEAVVGWFGAVQSQDVPGSMWGVGQRLPVGTTAADLHAALDGGRILRTHTMRPTWHYVLPAELPWLLKLTSPRVQQLCRTYYRRLELEPATLARAADVMATAVEGGRHLTKPELIAEVERAGIPTDGLRSGFLLMYAELEGVICSGARRGRTHTYALLAERVPLSQPLSREEALVQLARRYFRSHGPAEPRDFAWWSGLTVSDAKRGLAMLGGDVERVTLDGTDWWWMPAVDGGPDLLPPPSPTIHLLPNYDEYLVSYRGRDVAFDASLLDGRTILDVFYAHVVALDGMLIGGWKRSLGKDEVVVTLDLLVVLSITERDAVDRAVSGFGRFLGLPARVDPERPAARAARSGPGVTSPRRRPAARGGAPAP